MVVAELLLELVNEAEAFADELTERVTFEPAVLPSPAVRPVLLLVAVLVAGRILTLAEAAAVAWPRAAQMSAARKIAIFAFILLL